MRRLILLSFLMFVLNPAVLCHADELMDAGRSASIDAVLQRAVSRGLINGGILLVGNRNGVLYTSSYGNAPSNLSGSAPIDSSTLFDIASLTKVFATAPAVARLLDLGLVSLMDPLIKWFPEFAGTGRDEITVLNLLTHTSGFDDIGIGHGGSMRGAIERVAATRLSRGVGNRFRYADINFILLGELVRRVSGSGFDVFVNDQIFRPLGMTSTMFNPYGRVLESVAPTVGSGPMPLVGIVQDENARALGGVAGHAGLFSSADDLAVFARMLLNGGKLGNIRILSERVVEQMTSPYYFANGRVVRGLGWDMHSPFSSPKGNHFTEISFGHTGYSGSSVWIDPRRNLFVILLTTRIDYKNKNNFNRLRSDLSTLAAVFFSGAQNSDPIN